MARLVKGIHGHFRGTIGNVVGSTLHGSGIVRSKAESIRNPNTEAQQAQRARFKKMTDFLRKARPVIDIGFKTTAVKMSALNAALSLNLKKGIAGVYPDLVLDYNEIAVSRGSLAGVRGAILTNGDPGQILLGWTDNATRNAAVAADKTMVVVFNPEQDEIITDLFAASRADAQLALAMPADYIGQPVHVWMAFTSESSENSSDSVYFGTVIVE